MGLIDDPVYILFIFLLGLIVDLESFEEIDAPVFLGMSTLSNR